MTVQMLSTRSHLPRVDCCYKRHRFPSYSTKVNFLFRANLNKENSDTQEIKKRTLLKISISIDVNPNHIFPATKRKKRILFDCTTKIGTYVLMRTWPNMNRFFSTKPSRSFHIETKSNHAHSILSADTCTLVKNSFLKSIFYKSHSARVCSLSRAKESRTSLCF